MVAFLSPFHPYLVRGSDAEEYAQGRVPHKSLRRVGGGLRPHTIQGLFDGIGRGSRPDTCPVALLETWMRLGRVNHGPLFRPIARKNGGVSTERLTDKHVARLVQKTALAAGIRGDLSEGERKLAFGGH